MRSTVKTLSQLSIVVILTFTPSAGYSIDLAWNQCPTDGGVSDRTFTCGSTGTPVQLFGTFSSPSDIPDFVAMVVSLDLWADTPSLPSFWNFSTLASPLSCNAGIVFGDERPESGCSRAANPWGTSPSGAESDAAFAYLPRAGGSLNRGHFLGVVFRPIGSPTLLRAETQTFAFRLDFYGDQASENGGACSGCATPLVIRFNEAALYRASSDAPIINTQPGTFGTCVSLSGGGDASCGTATQNKTWGALKSLYR